MKEIIGLKHGEKTKIANKYGCTIHTVRIALKGYSESKLAMNIRKEALRRGAIERPQKLVKLTDSPQ
ncbi:hypothetical protein D0T49_04465 [Paludibacter sp. 221]|uniref:hypothetical protein n=1 Tax=Paludibacter sp. 221 TaxID=2302939 RepID=UPI0013CFC4E1|nr:hypothetical protein [Paludibacter sp. 221]NDV46290.1 hypothetical protein [Paludibacter sp. 221]